MRDHPRVVVAFVAVGLASCVPSDPEVSTTAQAVDVTAGRAVWFDKTYGGQKFFTFLKNHPDPARRIEIGFRNVIETPRAQRFDVWGVINDPDCTANPAGGPDLCPHPE